MYQCRKGAGRDEAMLILSDETLIGRGGWRECHFHPMREDRCLKVQRPDKSLAQRRAIDPFYKRLRPLSYYDQNLRDIAEFKKLWAQVKGVTVPPLPKVDGLVDTNLGQALCMELIRDADELVSQPLRVFIAENGFTDDVRQALDDLECKHLDKALFLRDASLANVLVQRLKNNQLRMLFIDGVGDHAVIPVSRIVKTVARKRIAKKFRHVRKACVSLHRSFENGQMAAIDENGILQRRQRLNKLQYLSANENNKIETRSDPIVRSQRWFGKSEQVR